MRDTSDLKHRKSLRLGLLLLSTLIIFSASEIAYARVVYERMLNVGSIDGVATGSGSTTSSGGSLAPATIVILAFLAFVMGLSMFGLLRMASRHINRANRGRESSPTSLVSTSPGEDEWKESPEKEEPEGIDDEIIRAMSEHKKSATAA